MFTSVLFARFGKASQSRQVNKGTRAESYRKLGYAKTCYRKNQMIGRLFFDDQPRRK